MSTIGLISDYRINRNAPEWYTAERYDFCEQISAKEIKNKNKKRGFFHFLFALI